ncbi:MAG: YcgN family cysteine cluster protein [Spirochaetales bacterium]|nr:YcgN family cysteine cluster protein [Spirochaetales bacterium]
MSLFVFNKKWQDFSQEEWERLCDHCGKCCLEKLENHKTKELFFTSIACSYLDIETVKCRYYDKRFQLDVDCVPIKDLIPEKLHYLPVSCSYRLIYEGKDLPSWHPLKTGDPLSTMKSGNSVKDFALEYSDNMELENFIIFEEHNYGDKQSD